MSCIARTEGDEEGRETAVFAEPAPGVAGPRPTTTTVSLDPGSFPYLIRPRGMGRARRVQGDVSLPPLSDPTRQTFADPMPTFGEPVTPRRSGMVQDADLPTPEGVGGEDMLDALSEATDMLGNREGFITPAMLRAMGQSVAGGAA